MPSIIFIGSEKQNHGVYVLVSRDTSIQFIEEHVRRVDLADFKMWFLVNVSLKEILRKRYVEICKVYSTRKANNPSKYPYSSDNFSTITKIWIDIIEEMLKSWVKRDHLNLFEKELICRDGFKVMEIITNQHHRSAIKYVRKMVEYFYTKDEFVKHLDKCIINKKEILRFARSQFYHLVKYFFCGEYKYYVNKYTYKQELNSRTLSEQAFSGLIPNIFTYSKKNVSVMKNNTLIRLRTLQFFDYMTHNVGSGPCSIASSFLNSCFGYETVKDEIDELVFLGLLRPSSMLSNIGDVSYIITDLGRLLINYFIYDYSYYESTFHDSEIPSNLINMFPYNYIDDDKDLTGKIILNRLKCIFFFVKYLNKCEVAEKEIYYNNKEKLNANIEGLYMDLNMFEKKYMGISKDIEKNVRLVTKKRILVAAKNYGEPKNKVFFDLMKKTYSPSDFINK